MRVVLGSDERTALTDAVADDLHVRGHDLVLVGPPGGDDRQWAEVGLVVGEMVAGARRWNDANVLVMSLRTTSPAVASEMLDAWFSTDADPAEAANIARLEPRPK